MQATIAFAVLMTLGQHPEADAAFADRARLALDQRNNAAYLSLADCPPEHRQTLTNVLRFLVPSFSSKPYLGDQLPQPVEGTTLLRIDLGGLGWEKTWPKVIGEYVKTYRQDLLGSGQHPLVISGLWFAAVIPDPELSGDSQYLLLYGEQPPRTAAEFRQRWTVNGTGSLAFGRIEGRSGVALQATRLIENAPTSNRGYFWQTFDSRAVAGENDPLENLTSRPPKHDASELIAAIPKHYLGRSGTLQAYFLANGQGQRQEKAPADIVTDSTGVRGVEIRNTLSCIVCHTDGIRHPTLDQYQAYILSGARIYAKDKATQQEIDRYLDSPIAKEIERNNADYAEGVALCNGLTPAENAAAVKQIVQLYDAPVTVEQAARELYTTPETWRLALGNYSRTYNLSGRLALMAQGQPMSRQQWEANFHLAQQVLEAWHAH